MNSLPMRLRVTGAFALSMAAVLTVSGLFLYARLSSHLSAALDRDLRLRSQDLAALVSQPQTSLCGGLELAPKDALGKEASKK